MSSDWYTAKPLQWSDLVRVLAEEGIACAPTKNPTGSQEQHALSLDGHFLRAYVNGAGLTCLTRYGGNSPEAMLKRLSKHFGTFYDLDYYGSSVPEMDEASDLMWEGFTQAGEVQNAFVYGPGGHCEGQQPG